MAFDIDAALRYVVEREGSDLHIKADSPPVARVHGALWAIQGADMLTEDDTEKAFHAIADPEKVAEFEETGETDLAYELAGVSRFRVSVFKQRGTVSIAFRVIPYQVRTIEDLGLPSVVSKLADETRGIILLTGTTGSGKSTTLAAMIDQINSNYAKHVVTLEDPIEYLHKDKLSIINQREVGSDTKSFAQAMRRVLRQDPDAILIGEMRDEETVGTALSAAETGHLVLSTLHTIDAVETINRIIDFFPPHHHQQVRAMLAGSLRGVISQRLVPTIDGSGRAPACEVLTMTGRVRDLISNPAETGKLGEVIAEGSYYGMQTFDQALMKLYDDKKISMEEALKAATHPHDFKLLVAAEGQRSTSVDQIYSPDHSEDAPPPTREPNGSGAPDSDRERSVSAPPAR